jgi:ligand-binding sensor domain-containing protein
MYKPLLTSTLSLVSIKALIRIYISVACCFLVSYSIIAQHENISFEHFTNENGLSAPVTSIIQDHYGFLWLATTDGSESI